MANGQVTANQNSRFIQNAVQISTFNAQQAQLAAAQAAGSVSAAAASAASAAASAASASGSLAAQLPQNLTNWAYTSSFQLVSATRDANEAIISASIVWPDGGLGVFTTDTASTAFPGAIDAWHATYINGSINHAITQRAVTRDAAGAVIAQPAIIIS